MTFYDIKMSKHPHPTCKPLHKPFTSSFNSFSNMHYEIRSKPVYVLQLYHSIQPNLESL